MTHTAETLQAAFGYLFPGEVAALKELAQSLPANPVVVNIGAGAGTSGLAFMESRPDLWLITIDTQQDSSPFGCLEAEKEVLKAAGLWGMRNEQFCLDSKAVGRIWSEYSRMRVEMVFIDGDHSYEGCAGDITAWLPNIRPGGIMAIHDYKKGELFAHDKDFRPGAPHPKPWPGVDKAVDELLVGRYEQVLKVDSLIAFRID